MTPIGLTPEEKRDLYDPIGLDWVTDEIAGILAMYEEEVAR